MMCHYRLIDCNKYTTLVGDVVNKRGYACVGARNKYLGKLCFPLDFSVNLKLLFTKRSLIRNHPELWFILEFSKDTPWNTF